ncbi:polysaccharide biosynthesis tyrosine autokinase [Natronoflexus pectinivorans]|uniref:non-specific protein-tyrosine kinase n=1 Tax=Natronoflexus pectinivorans TaxID=682526 RepID=A0A4R2GKH6_9BACT|nr:polysaccharide biosynthesis tyrosine autokinase [Natronoflexus pectinivorans]TCO09353.1 capsular exopolysaccharide synthesis family protein [Natronoflexus pectinivorans]
MNYQLKPNNNNKQPLKSDSTSPFVLDYKKILVDILRYWWLFIITLGLSLFTVFMMHRYAQPVYRASMTMLMEERGTDTPQRNMMEGFGLSGAMRSTDNQIAILRSFETIREAIEELDFHVSYYKTGRVKSTELYGNVPFTVHFDSISPQIINTPIYLSIINENTFRLNIDTEQAATFHYGRNQVLGNTGSLSFSETFRFNEPIMTPFLSIIVENHNLNRPEERGYYFQFNNPNILASSYQSRFSAPRPSENTSIVRLFVTGHNNTKNITFLNKLAEVFIRINLERKNQIATNTIQFIEQQLIIISDSLAEKGTELSQFRTTHQIQSVSAQANLLFSRLENLANQSTQIMLTRQYYEYLKDYFSADTIFNQTLAPASYPVDNVTISAQISKLTELNMERQALKYTLNRNTHNPYFVELEHRMEVARQTLLRGIENQVALINEELSRIDEKRELTTNELYQLPEKERQLFGIERQFDLNNEVYTFLLRKRSEAQIQKASNTPDHSVLESARATGMVSPTISSDRQRAILIGLVLPLIFIVIRQLLNNRIQTPDDVERITNLPIIGHIIHNPKELDNVVYNYPKSIITETFRRVRSRLEYLTGDKESPIIAVSSSMPGEGKTFCALNLASVFAISGKKTLLVGFDMRKPGLNRVLSFDDSYKGLSNYLIGKAKLKEVIQPGNPENLYILPSGTIPPNPAELIGSPRTEELFKKLREEFDIILLDTPPMGVVADGYLLARHADSVVFLTRQNITIREVFAHTVRQMNEEGIKNIGVLINDINIKKGILGYNYGYGYGYGYGYAYGYGNGYGYYEE